MQIQIETPGRAAGSEKEQLLNLRSYLSRLSSQLQWAFDTLEPRETHQEIQVRTPETEEKPDPRETFSQIKNLIVKSADIVNAYSEAIEKKLSGTYTAKSEFGSFEAHTRQELKATSQELQQLYTLQRELSGEVQGLVSQSEQTSAYIRTGLMSQDPQPVYGMEIGQRTTVDGRETFNKFARFTADRLSFFDRSDVEVAYISDYKLSISNARVAGTLELGSRFRILNQDGLAFQWTGGKTDGIRNNLMREP